LLGRVGGEVYRSTHEPHDEGSGGTVSLKRRLPVLVAVAVLAAPLSACGTGGETDSQNNGSPTPTAAPTHDDGDSGGGDDSSKHGADGSGD
jgi:hypothetical protein